MSRARHLTVTLVFTGRFEPASFAEFARHRAGRLALHASQAEFRPGQASITVTGQADLVDAFEQACSLGPIDCLVDEVTVRRTRITP
jgi:acylphosphatase